MTVSATVHNYEEEKATAAAAAAAATLVKQGTHTRKHTHFFLQVQVLRRSSGHTQLQN